MSEAPLYQDTGVINRHFVPILGRKHFRSPLCSLSGSHCSHFNASPSLNLERPPIAASRLRKRDRTQTPPPLRPSSPGIVVARRQRMAPGGGGLPCVGDTTREGQPFTRNQRGGAVWCDLRPYRTHGAVQQSKPNSGPFLRSRTNQKTGDC